MCLGGRKKPFIPSHEEFSSPLRKWPIYTSFQWMHYSPFGIKYSLWSLYFIALHRNDQLPKSLHLSFYETKTKPHRKVKQFSWKCQCLLCGDARCIHLLWNAPYAHWNQLGLLYEFNIVFPGTNIQTGLDFSWLSLHWETPRNTWNVVQWPAEPNPCAVFVLKWTMTIVNFEGIMSCGRVIQNENRLAGMNEKMQ